MNKRESFQGCTIIIKIIMPVTSGEMIFAVEAELLPRLLAQLFSHSVTNKTLSRLFKALPGGGEAGFRGVGVAVPALLSSGELPAWVLKPDVESSDVM